MLAHPRTARGIAPPNRQCPCLRHICGRQKCVAGIPRHNVTSRSMVPTQLDQSGARGTRPASTGPDNHQLGNPVSFAGSPLGQLWADFAAKVMDLKTAHSFPGRFTAACRNFGPPVDAYPGAPGLWRDRGKLRCRIFSASLIEELLLNCHKSHSSQSGHTMQPLDSHRKNKNPAVWAGFSERRTGELPMQQNTLSKSISSRRP